MGEIKGVWIGDNWLEKRFAYMIDFTLAHDIVPTASYLRCMQDCYNNNQYGRCLARRKNAGDPWTDRLPPHSQLNLGPQSR